MCIWPELPPWAPGFGNETPAFNVNRLCGSGLQAVVSAAQCIELGDCHIAIAGGAESMTRGPYLVPAARWGARMGDVPMIDFTLGALHDPFDRIHMGVTAENVAASEGITRDMQDALALESQQRAARAIAEGRFKSQITPVPLPARKGQPAVFDTDEHVRGNVTLEQLAAMKTVFQEGGTVTAGNASGLNDGAAAIVLSTAQAAREHKRHRWRGWSAMPTRVWIQAHGSRSHPRQPQSARGRRSQSGRPRCHRVERSLCGASLCRGAYTGV